MIIIIFQGLKLTNIACTTGASKLVMMVSKYIQKWEKITDVLSPITPIQSNTDFISGMTDNGFCLQENACIKTLKDLFKGDKIMSFDQLRLKYKLP